MAFSKSKILQIAVVVLRVVLGGIFIYAGYVKLVEPWQLFAAGIADYEVVPMWAAKFLAHTLPWFEVLIGLLLIAGRFMRISTGQRVPAVARVLQSDGARLRRRQGNQLRLLRAE